MRGVLCLYHCNPCWLVRGRTLRGRASVQRSHSCQSWLLYRLSWHPDMQLHSAGGVPRQLPSGMIGIVQPHVWGTPLLPRLFGTPEASSLSFSMSATLGALLPVSLAISEAGCVSRTSMWPNDLHMAFSAPTFASAQALRGSEGTRIAFSKVNPLSEALLKTSELLKCVEIRRQAHSDLSCGISFAECMREFCLIAWLTMAVHAVGWAILKVLCQPLGASQAHERPRSSICASTSNQQSKQMCGHAFRP